MDLVILQETGPDYVKTWLHTDRYAITNLTAENDGAWCQVCQIRLKDLFLDENLILEAGPYKVYRKNAQNDNIDPECGCAVVIVRAPDDEDLDRFLVVENMIFDACESWVDLYVQSATAAAALS